MEIYWDGLKLRPKRKMLADKRAKLPQEKATMGIFSRSAICCLQILAKNRKSKS